MVFTEDEIILDFINGLQGDGTGYGAGTYVEGSNNNLGSLTIPGNLHVKGTGTVDGWTYANGGIYCDDMVDTDDDTDEITYHTLYDDDDSRILKNDDDTLDDDVFDYSFTVEDNTGVTTVVGIIYPNGGIKVGDDLFTVQDDTGRTDVQGLTRPDGGIQVNHNNINNGQNIYWSVRTDGYLFARGNVSVEQDFYLGSDKSELRFFERFPRTSTGTGLRGASTTYHGQDAAEVGGNLVLVPGFGTGEFAFHENGAIYLGRVGRADDFIIQRQALDANYANDEYFLDGGQTIFSGQDSSANGGTLRISAGDATGAFTGGDIILATGLGNTVSTIDPTGAGGAGLINGNIILGPAGFSPDYGQRLNFDLHITRPPITDASDAGDTIILGQLTRSDNTVAGDLIFTAGDGSDKGGDLYLQPGEARDSALLATENQGIIYVGGFEDNEDLLITRFSRSIAGTPGNLYLTGQNSVDGNGGDIYFVTGGGPSSELLAAVLHLQVGSGVGSGGRIIWDTQLANANFPDDLYIKREPNLNAGTSTTIQGQTNTAVTDNGGNVDINAGDGFTFGGSVNFFGGKGHGNNGGSINVAAGTGSASAGDISITAGGISALTFKNGGSITIWPGNGNPNSVGQDLTFSAGSGPLINKASNGNVVFSGDETLVYVPFVLFQQNNNAFSGFVNTFEVAGNLHISSTTTGSGFFAYTSGSVTTRVLRPRLDFSTNVREPFYVPQEDGVDATNELNAMVQEIYNGLRYHGFFA